MEENWTIAQEIWEIKSKEHGLSQWTFGLNRRKTSLGITNYTKKIISLSKYFLSGHSCDRQKIENAILHEIAHVLAGHGAGHGSKWKEIAKKIGCNAEVCGLMDQPPGKYVLTCPNTCFQKECYRKPQLKDKLCKYCNGRPLLISRHSY